MKLKEGLLSNDVQYKTINRDLCEKLKKIYISTFCWTWNDNYRWPKNELFIRIISNKKTINLNKKQINSFTYFFVW